MDKKEKPCPLKRCLKQLREGCFLIAKIHHLSERIFSRLLKKYDLEEINPAQGRILFALWKGDGIFIQELGKRTSLEKSTLTSMLDRLEKSAFVVRAPSKEDRRKVLITLTEKGKLQEVYARIACEKIELLYKGFTGKERDEFEAYLMRALDNLTSFENDKG